MRTALISTYLASLMALTGASGCGGNVVVDGEPTGPGGTGAGAAAPGPTPMESCHAFCELFDTPCPGHTCRAKCASLLSTARPCSDLAGEFFQCMSTGIQIPQGTPCEWIPQFLDPLFTCMGITSACTAEFAIPCKASFDAYKACQLR